MSLIKFLQIFLFGQIPVNELIKKTKINDVDLIIDVIVEIIRNNVIYAKYFSNSKAVVNQQAKIDEMDHLMVIYKEWESKKEYKKFEKFKTQSFIKN